MSGRYAILGAGVIGLMTARELLARGHRVVLVDVGQPGREASWAGGGIVAPLYPWHYRPPINALAVGAAARYGELAGELRTETGIDIEYAATGMLMLDLADRELALAWCRSAGRRVVCCDDAGARLLQPGIGSCREALWFEDVGNVRNPRLLQALLASVATQARAQCHWQAQVALAGDADRIDLRVNGDRQEVDAVVLAAGAWSSALAAPLGVQLAVQPVRGQMLRYAARPGLLRRMVMRDGRYLIPRRDGSILAGSTMEYAGFDKHATDEARLQLQAAVEAILPALAGVAPEQQWAGLRPGSPGGVPYIARIGAQLLVNAGHFRNGLVLAPASARLGVELLLGETTSLDPAPYALDALRPRDLL